MLHNDSLTPDEAFNASQTIGPKEYIITEHNDDTFCFVALGCGGENNPKQREVAVKMNQIVGELKQAGIATAAILFAGDNMYPNGADKPNSEKFNTHVFQNFADKTLENICDTAIIASLGNHDRQLDAFERLKDQGKNTTKAIAGLIPGANMFADYVLPSYVKKCFVNSDSDKAATNQCAQSFLKSAFDPDISSNKAELYGLHSSTNRVEIPYKSLSKFNMPYPFDAYLFEPFQLLVADSNILGKSFLDYLRKLEMGESLNELNQNYFLNKVAEQAQANKYPVILLEHHPIEIFCKRSIKSHFDAKMFLSNTPENNEVLKLDLILQLSASDPELVAKIRKILPAHEDELLKMDDIPKPSDNYDRIQRNGNFSAYIRKMLPNVSLIICAHEHCNSLSVCRDEGQDSNQVVTQIIAGAGGCKTLENRRNFNNDKDLGGLDEDYGFWAIICDKKTASILELRYYSINGVHLCFPLHESEPRRTPSADDRIEKLRTSIVKACHDYFNALAKFQMDAQANTPTEASAGLFGIFGNFNHKTTYTPNDVKSVHAILNYLNQPQLPDYISVLKQLMKLINDIYNKYPDTSPYNLIKKALMDTHDGKDIESLYREVAPEIIRAPSPLST